MIDEERRPLLGGEGQTDNQTDNNKVHSNQTFSDKFRERWPIAKLLIVALMMFISSSAIFPALIQLVRSFACAEYYEQHPHSAIMQSLVSFKNDPVDLCDIDEVERRSASILTFIQIIGSLMATISLFILQPKLRKWGKKTIFLISIAILLFDRVPALFLPIGYPFRSPDDPMPISSTTSFRIFIGLCMLGNSMGSEFVGLFCMRLFVTEASSTGNKTQGLLGIAQMNIISITIGPALTAWLGTLIPFSSSTFLKLFTLFRHTHDDQERQPTLPGPPTHGPIPPVPPAAKIENVSPYLISTITILLTLVIAYILLPADHREDEIEESASDDHTNKTKVREPFYWRLWPRKDIDGKRDWRILKVVLVAMLHMGSAYTINIYITFFGHSFHWGPESVSLILSWLGIARLFSLFIVTPFLIAYLERVVQKPAPIQHLKLEEIKAIAKEAPVDEPPVESASEFRPRETYGSTSEEEEDNTTSHTIRGAVVTWRALVDRSVLKLSWCFDISGWALCAIFTVFGSASLLLLSAAVVALGAPAQAVRQAVDLVIVGDVLARTAEHPHQRIEGETGIEEDQQVAHSNAQADEIYFSLSSIFESTITFIGPIFSTYVYNRTLTTFPAANWLTAVVMYTIAFILHFSIPLHVRSTIRNA
ncbi:uncharacterized protein FA14DRAFT_191150 [Meira miltonrushii]|uniref:MFS general substrate transporter n=1 Tax=Meira miltonrushii TaxID=1280837 RepID=A0A316V8Y4_9BASI|nr:uncharacterized protein FA14DRAFT_191150 [Meira miltonrushii]PWN34057.1 hypothetical protein FA14DRAFT_191150 [Meira miltonrushii]